MSFNQDQTNKLNKVIQNKNDNPEKESPRSSITESIKTIGGDIITVNTYGTNTDEALLPLNYLQASPSIEKIPHYDEIDDGACKMIERAHNPKKTIVKKVSTCFLTLLSLELFSPF